MHPDISVGFSDGVANNRRVGYRPWRRPLLSEYIYYIKCFPLSFSIILFCTLFFVPAFRRLAFICTLQRWEGRTWNKTLYLLISLFFRMKVFHIASCESFFRRVITLSPGNKAKFWVQEAARGLICSMDGLFCFLSGSCFYRWFVLVWVVLQFRPWRKRELLCASSNRTRISFKAAPLKAITDARRMKVHFAALPTDWMFPDVSLSRGFSGCSWCASVCIKCISAQYVNVSFVCVCSCARMTACIKSEGHIRWPCM